MIDEFSEQLLDAEFDLDNERISLLVKDTRDNFGRTLASHQYPHRDGAKLRDMGGEPRRTECTLVFLPPGVIDKFTKLVELQSRGEAGLFTHPLFGSYAAYIERIDLSANAADRDYLEASAVFAEDIDTADQILRVDILPTTAEVEAAAAELAKNLTELGLESDAGTESVSQVKAWDSADPTTLNRRKLSLELAEITQTIQEATDALDLATSVDRYPLIQSFNLLQSNVSNFARRIMKKTPRLTTHTVKVSRSLLAIMQDIYGGAKALEQADRTRELNDIKNPAMVEGGTVLTVEMA